MEFNEVPFNVWAKDLSEKVALLDDKVSALIRYLELEMKITEQVIIVSTKQREGGE